MTSGGMCWACKGNGRIKCTACEGARVLRSAPAFPGGPSQTHGCTTCNQAGRIACDACKGSGRLP